MWRAREVFTTKDTKSTKGTESLIYTPGRQAQILIIAQACPEQKSKGRQVRQESFPFLPWCSLPFDLAAQGGEFIEPRLCASYSCLGMFLAAIIVLNILVGSASAQQKGWETEWNETLAAARKEGRVVVATSPDPAMRDIAATFKARFGITVEHLAGSSSQLAGRLRSERQAGINTIDVFLSGIQTVANVLYQEKMLDPLKPALFLPDVVDPAKWKRGKMWFVDPEGTYVLRVYDAITGLLHVNTDYVKAAELTKGADLLNPKWRSKISTEDPTSAGSGSNTAARIYVQMGEEFMKRLYVDQKPVITRERRQLTDWLARGTYPISFGAHSSDVERMRKEGFPLKEIYGFTDMPPALTGSPWLVSLVNKAPHPNAARVFVNWIISKEGLEIYSRAEGRATLRKDVDESFIPAGEIPKPGVNYFDTYDWQWTVSGKEKVRLRMKEILGR